MKTRYLCITLFFLASLSFFSFQGLAGTKFLIVYKLAVLLLVVYLFFHYKQIARAGKEMPSYKYVLALFLLPFLTHISCYIENGQSIFTSINAFSLRMILCIFFLLIYKKIPSQFLINLLVICALIRTGLTLIEQFTYPNVPFAFRMDGYDDEGVYKEVEIRSGFYRFLISDAYFLPMICGFYSFGKIFQKYSTKYILIFLFCCLGIYMDQTRQIMFSFLLCLAMTPLLNRGKKNLIIAMVLCLIGGIIYSNAEVLFGELGSQTSDDINSDNIRLLSYAYYWENKGDIIATLFGNGVSGGEFSSYGLKLKRLQDVGLFTSDIGIVGAIYLYGLVIVSTFLLYYFYVVRKNWHYIDNYLRLMLISILINIPLLFPIYNMTSSCFECFMAFLFYLTDKSILENKKRLLKTV